MDIVASKLRELLETLLMLALFTTEHRFRTRTRLWHETGINSSTLSFMLAALCSAFVNIVVGDRTWSEKEDIYLLYPTFYHEAMKRIPLF